jgi:hypothetical protein
MRFTCLLCSLPLLLSLGWAGVARADTDSDRQAAQALFDKADELMKRRDFAAACPKLEEVTRLVPDGLGAKLTLAECYEGAGKLASAWSTYSQVESLAARLNQPERQTLARDKVAQLKPRLAKLVIKVPPAVSSLAGLEIKRDGKPVGAAQFGEAIPADVGDHTVEATATGKLPWSQPAKIAADGSTVTVEVQPLKDAPPGTQPPGSAAPATPEDEPTWLLPLGIAVGSVGVAGLVVGGVMGGLAMGKQSNAEEMCPNGRCSAEGNDARTSAGTFADVSTAMFIAGGVLAAAGVVIIIVAPKGSSDEQPAATAALQLGPGSIGIKGAF